MKKNPTTHVVVAAQDSLFPGYDPKKYATDGGAQQVSISRLKLLAARPGEQYGMRFRVYIGITCQSFKGGGTA